MRERDERKLDPRPADAYSGIRPRVRGRAVGRVSEMVRSVRAFLSFLRRPKPITLRLRPGGHSTPGMCISAANDLSALVSRHESFFSGKLKKKYMAVISGEA